MYQVRWLQSALDELTVIWTNADSADRKDITRASHEIEQRLRSDPVNEGESRNRGRRVLFAEPLAVLFRPLPDDMVVEVLHVWQY
jgi:hypothetical protein